MQKQLKSILIFPFVLLLGITMSSAQMILVCTSNNEIYSIDLPDNINGNDGEYDIRFQDISLNHLGGGGSSVAVTYVARMNIPQGLILYDIAIVSNVLYGIGSRGEILKHINGTDDMEIIGQFPNGLYSSLAQGGSDALFSAENITGNLYRYNIGDDSFQFMETLASQDIFDLTFFDGRVMYESNDGESLEATNMANGETTKGFCITDDIGVIYGLTTTYTGCVDSRLFSVNSANEFYEFNFETDTTQRLFLDNEITNGIVFGLASLGEYQANNCGHMYEEAVCEVLATPDFIHNSIEIYPNPSQGFIEISSSENISRIEAFNLQGKKVLDIKDYSYGPINIQDFSNGVYLLRIESQGKVETLKFIKN